MIPSPSGYGCLQREQFLAPFFLAKNWIPRYKPKKIANLCSEAEALSTSYRNIDSTSGTHPVLDLNWTRLVVLTFPIYTEKKGV